VAYKEPKIEKVFFTIGEVAKMMNVETTTIRYWENQFEALKPQKNKKGNRLFAKDDIERVKLIHHLVKEQGLTIKGAKQKLKDNSEETLHNFEIVKKLQKVKQELVEILEKMEDEHVKN
jgi:DNA-binding transcriptional MerR regulator